MDTSSKFDRSGVENYLNYVAKNVFAWDILYRLVTSLFVVRATVQLIEQFFLQNIIERDGIMFL